MVNSPRTERTFVPNHIVADVDDVIANASSNEELTPMKTSGTHAMMVA
jgi:hypothetical protein